MAEPRYEVLASDQVLAAMRAEIQRVRQSGKLPQADPQLRLMYSALSFSPLDVGEARDPLPGLDLQQRVALF